MLPARALSRLEREVGPLSVVPGLIRDPSALLEGATTGASVVSVPRHPACAGRLFTFV